jgi:hypothetical protein
MYQGLAKSRTEKKLRDAVKMLRSSSCEVCEGWRHSAIFGRKRASADFAREREKGKKAALSFFELRK